MRKKDLNGIWQLRIQGNNVYGIPEEFIDASVPGSVYQALLAQGLMPDPYYRDNELDAFRLMENDFEYRTEVEIGEEFADADELLLRFEGIDTLADIYWNGEYLGHACNMHRTWEFPIEIRGRNSFENQEAFNPSLTQHRGPVCDMHGDKNELRVVLHSPLKYIREE